jgi:hypothetical protein
MHRSPRLLPVAIAAMAGLIAALLPAGDARAQANVQRCTPSNTTHTVVVRLPGIKIAEQTCVIRFGQAGSVKAWVHTKWRRTNFQTRLRRYTVNARLELRDVPSDKRLNCRYAAVINTSRAGERTCETTPQPTLARGWTGDGTVAYDAGNGTRVRRLRGSPSV